jgi:carbohydrate esterase-like sialic acid-specific acetylesterase
MKILNGLWDHQVLQRNKRNLSETFITGKSSKAGTLFLSVTNASTNKSLPNLAKKKISTIKRGNFKTKITGLPTGGPYNLTLKLVDKNNNTISKFTVQDILVGDLWILAGQSNMEGIGLLKDAAKPNKNVRAFYMNDHWDIAKDPIHNLPQAFAQIHQDFNCGNVMSHIEASD